MNTSLQTPPKTKAPPVRPKEKSREIGRRARGWLFRLLMVAPVIVGFFIAARFLQFRHLASATEQMTVPTVQVAQPQAGPSQTEVTLPGNLTPYSEASLYARTNGYLAAWHTDLGARVTEGQLMAEISAPDVDAQLNQAVATLAQAQATLQISGLNFKREQDLLATRVASQQEFDQSRATFDAAAAAVKAAQANAQNLTVQQGFQKITAPFPGIVTARNVDVGDLITAGSNASTGASQPLFHLARTDILRVFIDVPQVYSPAVSVGTKAYLQLAEFPGEKFEGRITNISGALNPATRTLLTEVQVPNPHDRLFPGAYANVHLVLPVKPTVVIPANAMIFRGEGRQVGVVDAQGIVHLKTVSIGHDFGNTLEIIGGLNAADRVVLNPSDSLAEGQKVAIQTKQ